ncbi:hypothetical protein NDU88_002202 [Pleurodeles waltl]|uniref:Uncharacterized protein n=1 Tax=Pleurodeles waltl TaxID=8319 RepID=A0AAV7UWX2_PLEWA|nr:hypothetical protein NDU88_002202 [Pleurodeles waltl]
MFRPQVVADAGFPNCQAPPPQARSHGVLHVVSPHEAQHLLSDQGAPATATLLTWPRAPSRLQSAARSGVSQPSATPLPARKLLSCRAPRSARLQRAQKQPWSPAPGAPTILTPS